MADGRKRKLPIGIENFEDIRTEKFYYVDKTGLIRELLGNWSKVNLFTRPRRFGKSLNMNMLKEFFEIGCKKELFAGLEISKETEICKEYMGQFPVVSVSLKGVNGVDYPGARAMMCSVVGTEAMRFQLLAESDKLSDKEKKQYDQLTMIDETNQEGFLMPDSVLIESLKILTGLLRKHYGKKVILLIDEYDVPLAKASERGYYDRMITLIRSFFEQALKTNDNLYFAVMTGCLRVAKESIFTGLNNLKVLSVTSVKFDEYFGFTDGEVREMLAYYGLEDSYDTVKDWYDGYRFGNVDVYCPWDVINYVDDLRDDPVIAPKDYWSNTSSNDVVRHFIEQAGLGPNKRLIENLIAGETVEKEIHQELTYDKLYDSIDNIWSVLFTTGYLTQRGKPDGDLYRLAIPNMEIRKIFTGQIMAMFKETARNDGEALQSFCDALQNGDAGTVEKQFGAYLEKTISIRDTFVRRETKENFYHGILIGILGYKDGWYVKSNRESGSGYSDIQVEIEDAKVGIIIEVKYAQEAQMDTVCRNALEQIEKKGYAKELYEDGMQTVLKYGIACYKKTCKVMSVTSL
ncbi:MAG: AAA family ATPase [Lachnospiraceae bacterium]|nr:AAA family ATPase [Lachnospiraceae bacterium]